MEGFIAESGSGCGSYSLRHRDEESLLQTVSFGEPVGQHPLKCGDAYRDQFASAFCYFGLREPLVQTQVLPYLLELVRGGVAI